MLRSLAVVALLVALGTPTSAEELKSELGMPLNLLRPVSQDLRHGATDAARRPLGSLETAALVKRVQHALARCGYDPGPIDGFARPQTAQAIRQYQRDFGLAVDGNPSRNLADHIEQKRS